MEGQRKPSCKIITFYTSKHKVQHLKTSSDKSQSLNQILLLSFVSERRKHDILELLIQYSLHDPFLGRQLLKAYQASFLI